MKNKNILAETHPELVAEWHPTKNGDLTPQDVTAGSGKKVWWLCAEGHEWKATVGNRSLGRGCPFCAGRKVVKGVNDLKTTHPELVAEWHPTKNGDLMPQDVTAGSGKKVWWQCAKGHEWQARVENRSILKNGCPYCSGNKIWIGFNDLPTTDPELVTEWHPTKNGDLTPQDVTAGSGKKVWWQCAKGHEWQAQIASRFYGVGCPVCSGNKALKGFNDLSTIKPELATEWHMTKNGELKPQNITSRSEKKVWWQCAKGHEWKARIVNRFHGNGCPKCENERHTSFPEQTILYYLKKVTEAKSRNTEFGKEIDVYLPQLHIGIEYNGYWHKDKALADEAKVSYFAERNIRIITIKEGAQNRIVGDTIEYVYSSSNKDALNWVITSLFEILHLNKPMIDTSSDVSNIYDQYILQEKENSPAIKRPGIAGEWHPTKNGKLTSDMVSMGSQKKVWWQCAKGHEWQATVCSRSAGHNCPVCSNQKVLAGFNDLATVNPKLSAEWHPTKNGDLTPQDVTAGSGKKVWWQCAKGHEWQATVGDRSLGRGCPFCAGRKVVKGVNDLKTTHPELAAEWHTTLNLDLTPQNVTAEYNKKVWWLCAECGGAFRRTPSERIEGKSCYFCSKNKKS